jgi:hypothetical protein
MLPKAIQPPKLTFSDCPPTGTPLQFAWKFWGRLTSALAVAPASGKTTSVPVLEMSMKDWVGRFSAAKLSGVSAPEPGAVVPVSCTIPPAGTLESEKFRRAGCATATLTVIGVSVLPAPLSPVRR